MKPLATPPGYGGTASNNMAISSLDKVLTSFYIPRMFEQIQVENPGYEFFKNMNTVVSWGPGNTASFPVRQKAKRGVVGGTAGRLPTGGSASYDQCTFDYTVFRTLVSFAWDLQMKGGHERYIKNILDQAITDAKQEFLRRMNVYLYGGSFGYTAGDVVDSPLTGDLTFGKSNIVARIATQTAGADKNGAAATPLEVKGAWRKGNGTSGAFQAQGGLWLQPGDFIAVASRVGGSNLVWLRKITSVDRSTYSSGYASIVLDAILPTGIIVDSPIYFASPVDDTTVSTATGVALTDSGVELADCQAGLLGIGNALFDHTYLGKTVAEAGGTDSYWKPMVKTGSTAGTNEALTFERIDALLLEMNQQFFVKPNLMVMNPGMWHEFISLSESNHSFFNQGQLPSGHKPGTKPLYSTANATTGQGDLKVLVDPYCPHERVITCDTGEMGYATAAAMGEAKEDGSFLRHTGTSYDEFHGWLRWAGQFIAHSPSSVGVLQDVTQDIVSL
mgnify:FL=1